MEPVSVRLARGGDDGTAKHTCEATPRIPLMSSSAPMGHRRGDGRRGVQTHHAWETPRTVSWDASRMHMRHFIAR